MTNEVITKLETQTVELLKDGYIVSGEQVEKINNLFNEIVNIYRTNIPTDEEGKTIAHKNFAEKIRNYGSLVGNTTYNFYLAKNEYLFLKSFLLNKVPYNRDNAFIWKLVKDEFFGKYDTNKSATHTSLYQVNDNEVFSLNITEITRISHLTASYEGKGADGMLETYCSILNSIGMVSKVYELFKEKGELLKDQGDVWLLGFEQVETIPQNTTQINS